MIDRFLQEVRRASKKAREQNAPLLLFLFCHGLEDDAFLLNHGKAIRGLTATQLKEATEQVCRLIFPLGRWFLFLFTPSSLEWC
jgi:hypothetical protein